MQAWELKRELGRAQDKLKAVKNAFQIHYSTLHDCAWMDRKKMLKALDETAEEVKKLLEDQSSGENRQSAPNAKKENAHNV